MALAFFLLMVVVFFSALFFIILNVIFIMIWRVKKRKGKTAKKRYLVIPIIFLIISILVESVPVGWVGMVRSGNRSNAKDIVIAESGKVVYWGYGANGDDTTENFTMDGTAYVAVLDTGSSQTWNLGKPVANIKFRSSEEVFNKVLSVLFGRDDTSTLYPIINEKGFDLYTIGGTQIYCPENQRDLVSAYYQDVSP